MKRRAQEANRAVRSWAKTLLVPLPALGTSLARGRDSTPPGGSGTPQVLARRTTTPADKRDEPEQTPRWTGKWLHPTGTLAAAAVRSPLHGDCVATQGSATERHLPRTHPKGASDGRAKR